MSTNGASGGERRARGRPRAFTDKTEQNTIQSLDRAMGILEALADRGAATLSDLAHTLDQSPATVYRVLVTLETRGIAELNPEDQTWAVGPKAFLIGSSFLRRTSVVERAQAPMRKLRAETGETANLGVARGDEVMFLAQVETDASLRAFFPPGTLAPLHASGIGKALLAWFDGPRRDAYLARAVLDQFTEHTITSPDALSEDLARIRARGYALDNEERARGMRCVAAPVFDASETAVAGLSISGPVARVTPETTEALGRVVARAAAHLSEMLGARLKP
ncbi:MAG: HTH-type transcriptional regulator BhcR [Pseudomonadota bacterium]